MSGYTEGRLTFRANGDANSYALIEDSGCWWMSVLMNGEQMTERQEANLRRLAACWNACAGIPTEDLETMASNPTAGMFGRLAAKACSERDQLLSAATAFSNYVHGEECATDGPVRFEYAAVKQHVYRIREAIASCEQPAAPVAAPEPTTYGYSTDGEGFHGQFASPEEAAVGCLQYDSALESVEVGRYVAVTAHDFVHAGGIADMVREQAGEEVGEVSDSWLSGFRCDKDACARLRKVVGDFLQAEEPPKFWRVVDVRTITRDELVASGHLDADDA